MEYVGCSGFMYDHWRETFYPRGLPKNKWFQYYIEHFNAVELNVTFYRLPKIETFKKWKEMTPRNFRFALKGSRYITHVKRLRDVEQAVGRFFEGASEIGRKLAVVLWQFPPQFGVEKDRLEQFLKILKPYKVRNAFEFRNESWIDEKIKEILEKDNYCYCIADWPLFLNDLTVETSYAYIRRHGHEGNYNTNFTEKELKQEKKLIRSLQKRGVKDVYIFFNNDYHGYAPNNAITLKGMLDRRR